VSALLHDWGKATVLFQQKLLSKNNQFKGDPLRHEWISCLLLNALVQSSGDIETDEAWLNLFISQSWNEELLKQTIVKNSDQSKALDQLPPLAQLVAWLIVSHHRLPNLKDDKALKEYAVNLQIASLNCLNLSKQIGVIKINLRKKSINNVLNCVLSLNKVC
jgi:CRISPR-associated endonuclease/helicase Cas3